MAADRDYLRQLTRIADALEDIARLQEPPPMTSLRPQWEALRLRMLRENDDYEPDTYDC